MIEGLVEREYAFGFHSDLDTDRAPKGLTEDVVRLISSKKQEPEWLLEWRLAAYRHFLTLEEPQWPNIHHPPDRLPGHALLGGAQAQGSGARQPR